LSKVVTGEILENITCDLDNFYASFSAFDVVVTKNMVKSVVKTVLVLGANSDVAKSAIKLYVEKNYRVVAASRNTTELKAFALKELNDAESY